MERTELTAHRLMEKAPITAEHYLQQVCRIIDQQFREDYAKENPVLVGAMILASALDYGTEFLGTVAQDGQRIATDHHNNLEMSIEKLADNIGYIADGLNEIASAIRSQSASAREEI